MSKQKYNGLSNSGKEKVYRDQGYTCQVCGKGGQEENHRLEVHHRDGDHSNCEQSNLEVQGRSCHERTHSQGIPSVIAAIKKALGSE
jgi:hypothetical protein